MIRAGTITRVPVDAESFTCLAAAHPEAIPAFVDGERRLLIVNDVTGARAMFVAPLGRLDVLAADPRVRLAATGSWLDGEAVSEQ